MVQAYTLGALSKYVQQFPGIYLSSIGRTSTMTELHQLQDNHDGMITHIEPDILECEVMELSCFFNDPADVGNLISGSSSFSKTSLSIWKFTVHVLLKPGLENFEHYFTSL